MKSVTLKLIIINTVIFFLQPLLPLQYLALVPKYALNYPWMFITSMFLHANFLHLFYNMLALLFFGTYFESKYGGRRLLVLYFISGVVGSIFFYLFNVNSSIPGLGASGAIFGIIGALAILDPYAIVYINFFPVPMIIAAFFWFLISLFGSLFVTSYIAHEAHLGGIITGFLYGIYLKRKLRERYYRREYYFEEYF